MQGKRRRWVKVVSGTLFTLAVGAATTFAARSTGEPVHDVALGDGGVWVTSGSTGMWGRVNRGAYLLDTVIPGGAPAGTPKSPGVETFVPRADVLQDGRHVVGVTTTGELVPIDPVHGTLGEGRGQLPEARYDSGEFFYRPSLVDLRGGTIAMIEPQSGRIWAQRLTPGSVPDLSALRDSSPSIASVDQGAAALAVDEDGNVKAVSATSGTVIDLPAEGDGFGEPERSTLDLGGRAVDISAVGDRWVVLDPTNGNVWVEGEEDPQSVDGASDDASSVLRAALQVPGPERDSVAVATDTAVSLVGIGSSSRDRQGIEFAPVSGARTDKTLRVTRPVVNGRCLFGVRSYSSVVSYQVACGNETLPAADLGLQDNINRRNPAVLRLNRGQVLINDLDTGRVYDLSLGSRDLRIDTWPTAKQLTAAKTTTETTTEQER